MSLLTPLSQFLKLPDLSRESLDGRTPAEWLARSGVRTVAAAWMKLQDLPGKNREQLYDGANGLRIATFHETPTESLERFKHFVRAFRKRWEIVAPEDVDDFEDMSAKADRLLLTFDDGFESNFAAAKFLADEGIRAIFFVVPEFVGRSVDEMMAAVSERGLRSKPIHQNGQKRGLSKPQLAEMIKMGHRIAAHNTCHRDLGKMTEDDDIEIEIGEVVETISSWLTEPCRDFAFAWGREKNLTPKSAKRLTETGCRIYASIRGLNPYGSSSPVLWRNAVQLSEPLPFVLAGLRGGMDHRVEGARRELGTLFAGIH